MQPQTDLASHEPHVPHSFATHFLAGGYDIRTARRPDEC